MSHVARFLCACAALFCFAGTPGSATPLLIDFETYPDADGVFGTGDDVAAGTDPLVPVGGKYASLGLTFLQGSLLRASFFDGNPDNHFISSTNPIATLSVRCLVRAYLANRTGALT